MTLLSPRFSAALVAIATMATASVLANGCGGIDCTETATCPAVDDASPDQSTKPAGDTSGDGSGDTSSEGSSEGSTRVPEGGSDADSWAPDATLDASHDGEAGQSDAPGPDALDSGGSDARLDAADGSDGRTVIPADAHDDGPASCSSGSSCVRSPPTGWSGPVVLFDGLVTATLPDCEGAYPNNAFTLNSMPTSPAPVCACECEKVAGACSDPTVTTFSDNQCGAANNCGAGGGPLCTSIAGTHCASGGRSVGVTALPQPTGAGSCSPTFTTTSVPGWTWARMGEVCNADVTASGAGCPAQMVCATDPPAGAGFLTKVCIWTGRDADCSATPGYSILYKYAAGTTDTRQCNAGTCNCGTPTNVSCTLAGVTVFRTSDCSDGGTPLTNLSLESGLTNCSAPGNSVVSVSTSVTTGGSCEAGGTAGATGSVKLDPQTTYTVCCAQ